MPDRSINTWLDHNQLAKLIVVTSTGNVPASRKAPKVQKKNDTVVALGSFGGQKGCKARAAKLSTEERKEIAKKAAAARWLKKSD